MSSLILKRPWSYKNTEEKLVRELSRKFSFPESIASYLVARGLKTGDEIESHLETGLSRLGNSNPFAMKGMNRAVKRLVQAVLNREKVGIFGDYDADGVTSSALVFLFLRELGLECCVYIPHREKEGYGLSIQGLDYLAAQGCRLVITVDCGIASLDEAEYAAGAGLDLIITDHHQPQDRLPRCLSAINPRQNGCKFPFKDLAGVGVAFNLIRALRTELYNSGHWNGDRPPNLRNYLDLVAIGTVSDIMPLFQDNRIMVKSGLQVLQEARRPGIRALMAAANLSGSLTSTDIAFRLGPRINAAGRMDHAMLAFDMLVSGSEEQAEDLARKLNRLNQQRQNQEREILREALAEIRNMGERSSYVLADSNWKLGIVGIVASKLVERVQRPVILLAIDGDEAAGSGRCPDGLDLFTMLSGCAPCLKRFGGHKAAAGVRLFTEKIDEFRFMLEEKSRLGLSAGLVSGTLDIDCEVNVQELFRPDYLQYIEALEPFGPGCPSPLFSMSSFSIRHSRIVGNSHLKLTVGNPDGNSHGAIRNLDMVAWGHGDKLSYSWHDMEIAFTPSVNNWQGRKTLQLVLKDARQRNT